MNKHMVNMCVFSPMPYTRMDLYNALCLVLGKRFVSGWVNLGHTLEYMLCFAILIMDEEGYNPYEPSCRVLRQAHKDYENGKFNFHGESG